MIKRLNHKRATPEDQTSHGADMEARILEVLEPLPSLPKCDFPADVITQAELQEYLQLVEAGRQQNELRLSIVERLSNGVHVETGELEPFIFEDSQLTCSWRALEEALGKKETSRLKKLVRETVYRRLRIRDSQGNILGWGSKRQSGSADP